MTITRKMADFAADVPSSIGSASQVLKVNAGATAYEWQPIGDTLPSGAAAGQVLQRNAGNSAYEWGTIAVGHAVVFPNWASPTNTYASSGTWSKGSLADDDFVWALLVGGGGGGGKGQQVNSTVYCDGGVGGGAMLLHCAAGVLDGATYSIGAGVSGNTDSKDTVAGNASSLTLTTSQGATAYTSNNTLNFNIYKTAVNTTAIGSYGNLLFNISPENSIANTITVPSGTKFGGGPVHATSQNQAVLFTFHCIFGGGAGHGQNHNGGNRFFTQDTSEYSGGGGASGVNGVYPGGGGGGNGTVNQNGGSGAAGNLRVYHV